MTDIADINIEMSWILFIVANNSDLVDIAIYLMTFVIVGILLEMGESDWNDEGIWFAWDVLLEHNFFNEFVGMQPDFS